jgi:flagellar biosynthetic protein FliR
MLSLGVRLALPVVALLLLVDIALALMGRINAQLQLLSLAFPAKMLAALLLLAASAPIFPTLLEHSGMRTVEALYRLGARR